MVFRTPCFHECLEIHQLAHLHAEFFPLFEVSGNVDVPALACVASDVEILLERHIALDSRLLVGGVLPDVVSVAVNGKFAHLFSKDGLGGNGVGETPVVYDVILDMRFSGDAVNAYKVIACYVCTFVIFVVSREIAELVEGFWFVKL